MKNLNESLLESIDLIQESQLESELDVIFAIGEQYAKVGLITEYASEEVVNEFGIIQESVFFQERATAPAGGEAAAAAKASGESIGSKIWTGIKNFFAMIGRAIKSAWEWLVGKAKDLGSWVKSWFSKDKKGAKGGKNKAAEVADKVKAAAEDASAEEAAKLAAEASAAAEEAAAELDEYAKAVKAEKDAAEFAKIEKAVDEFDEYGKLIEQLRNDPALKTNTATVLRKIYDALNNMSARLDDVKGKASGNLATTSGNYDDDMALLKKIAVHVYGRKNKKDKNLKNAIDTFCKDRKIEKFDVASLFFGESGEGRNAYVQWYDVVYDFTFINEIKTLPSQIINAKSNIDSLDAKVNKLIGSRVYSFHKTAGTNESGTTDQDAQSKILHEAIRECENFSSKSVNITDDPKKVKSFADNLENKLMPHITHGTAEMLAYQRYITDVFAEFKKRVSSN